MFLDDIRQIGWCRSNVKVPYIRYQYPEPLLRITHSSRRGVLMEAWGPIFLPNHPLPLLHGHVHRGARRCYGNGGQHLQAPQSVQVARGDQCSRDARLRWPAEAVGAPQCRTPGAWTPSCDITYKTVRVPAITWDTETF